MKGIKIYIDDYTSARKALIVSGDNYITVKLDNIELSINRPDAFGRKMDSMMREVKPDNPKYNEIIERYKELHKRVSIIELL